MSVELLKKFGQELKAVREQKDIPLQQIFNKTRIDIKFLHAIEDGNFEIMPEVYLRAFIKEYAKSLDLDPNVVIQKYDSAKQGRDIITTEEKKVIVFNEPPKVQTEYKPDIIIEQKPVYKPEPEIRVEEKQNSFFKPEITPEPLQTQNPPKREFVSPVFSAPVNENNKSIPDKRFIYAGLIIGSLVVILLVYLVFIKNGSTEVITEKPFDEVVEENQSRYEETPPQEAVTDSTKANTAAVNDSLTLSIASSETCWIGATMDKVKDLDFILYSGQKRELRATGEYSLIVGNAGAIELTLNGRKLNLSEKKGTRKMITVNKDGITSIK